MSTTIDVKVPDIGDFKDVPVIEIFVKPGDTIKAEDSLVSLESDKATMDVPSPGAGVVKELKVKLGDKVSEGSVMLTLETAGATAAAKPATPVAAKDAPKRRRCSRRGPSARRRDVFGRGRHRMRDGRARLGTRRLQRRIPRGGPGARRPCSSSATRRSAACASTSAAFRRRRCLHVAAVMDEAKHFADLGVTYRRACRRPRQVARTQIQSRREADQWSRRNGQVAQSHRRRGRRRFPRRAPSRGHDQGRPQGRQVRAGDHRRGVGGGEAAVPARTIRASSIRPARSS